MDNEDPSDHEGGVFISSTEAAHVANVLWTAPLPTRPSTFNTQPVDQAQADADDSVVRARAEVIRARRTEMREKRRTRLLQSCKRCKMMKKRCYQQKPTCSACAQANLECEYAVPVEASGSSDQADPSESQYNTGDRLNHTLDYPRSSSPPAASSPRFDGARYSPTSELSTSDLEDMRVVGSGSVPSVRIPVSKDRREMPEGTTHPMYRHKWLEDGEIRLLCVHTCVPGTMVSCSLRPIALTDLEAREIGYHALSYAWGEVEPTALIQLKDVATVPSERYRGTTFFKVGRNLHEALEALAYQTSGNDAWFWIDALCIDQEDAEEKSAQLPLMIDIYNYAWSVHIWLGGDERFSTGNNTTGSLDFISTIVNLKFLDHMLNNSAVDEDVLNSFVAFAKVLNRPWFRRRWVIQEVSAAKRASVQCGSKRVSWVDFADAVQLLMANLDRLKAIYRRFELSRLEPDALDHLESIGAGAIVYAAANTLRKTADGKIVTRAWDTERLVMTFSHFEATDPRDTIYALTSLASDGTAKRKLRARRNPDYSYNLLSDLITKPNYQCSAIEVYIAFVNHCIKRNKSLDIICRHWALPIPTTNDHTDKIQFAPLPSWIGDISNSAFGSPSRPSGRLNGASLVGKPGKHIYNASVQQVSDVDRSVSSSPYILHAPGIQLGIVTEVSPRIVEGTISYDSLRMLGWHKDSHANDLSDLMWRVLVADRTDDGEPAPTWWRRACMWCLANTSADGDLSTSKLLHAATIPEMVHRYLRRVQAVVWNRRFFVCRTSGLDGRLLHGLGPRDMQVGDSCCILFGCSVPVILRPLPAVIGSSHIWTLAGESYVYGMMDGEAGAHIEQGKVPIQRFEIA